MSLSQDASVDGARTGQAAYPALVLRAFNLERRAQQRCSSFEVLVGFCCGCKRWGRCWVMLGEFRTGGGPGGVMLSEFCTGWGPGGMGVLCRVASGARENSRACQFFCVWGLEVGGDSVGVGGGELGEFCTSESQAISR